VLFHVVIIIIVGTCWFKEVLNHYPPAYAPQDHEVKEVHNYYHPAYAPQDCMQSRVLYDYHPAHAPQDPMRSVVLYYHPAHAPQDPMRSVVLYYHPAHAPQDPMKSVVLYHYHPDAPQDPIQSAVLDQYHPEYTPQNSLVVISSPEYSPQDQIIDPKMDSQLYLIQKYSIHNITFNQHTIKISMSFMMELYMRVLLNFHRILSISLCRHNHISNACKRLRLFLQQNLMRKHDFTYYVTSP
jgi:hypothetical protein